MTLLRFGLNGSKAPGKNLVNAVNPLSANRVEDPSLGGRALRHPMVRDMRGDFDSVVGAENEKQKITQVLATAQRTGKSTGDIAAFPEFGSKLHLLVGRNLDETTLELAKVFTLEAMKTWLPQVQVLSVTAVATRNSADEQGIQITMIYKSAITGESTQSLSVRKSV